MVNSKITDNEITSIIEKYRYSSDGIELINLDSFINYCLQSISPSLTISDIDTLLEDLIDKNPFKGSVYSRFVSHELVPNNKTLPKGEIKYRYLQNFEATNCLFWDEYEFLDFSKLSPVDINKIDLNKLFEYDKKIYNDSFESGVSAALTYLIEMAKITEVDFPQCNNPQNPKNDYGKH